MSNNPSAVGQTESLRKRLFSSLRARMLLYFGLTFGSAFLLVSLILILGVPFTDFQGEYRAEVSEAFTKLEVAADQKKSRLERWLLERRGDARVLAESEIMAANVMAVRSILKEFMATGLGRQEAWERIRNEASYRTLIQHLKLVKAAYGFYEEIDIADAETGEILAATKDSELGRGIAENNFFIQPLRKSGVYVNFERDVLGDRDVDFFVSHAINRKDPSSQEARPLAVLLMRVETDDFFKSLLHAGAGLGQTGEVVFINQEGKILAPLKYPLPDGTRPAPLEYQLKAKPAMLAAQGKEGALAAEDYRSVPVLAALRSIQITPETTWGMVVKQDRSEVLGNLKKTIFYFFLTFATVIFVLAVLTYWVAAGLSRPIQMLSRTALRVESGDLSARSPATGPHEVKILATAFNSMAQQIQDWHGELERRIQERTHALSKANEELEKQKKFLEAVLDCMEDGIVACDNNAILTLFNRATREFHGLPQSPIPAEQWVGHYDLYLADGKTPMKMEDVPLFRTLKGERVDNVEMVIAPKEGRVRTLWATGRALRNGHGESLGAVVSMHDITARKRAEEELRTYRENLEKMVEERTSELKAANEELRLTSEIFKGMPGGVFLIRPEDGKIFYANQGFEGMFKYGPGELIGKHVSIVNAPTEKSPEETAREISAFLKKNGRWEGEVYNIKKDGTLFWNYATVCAFEHYEYGTVWIAIHTDITARKQAEEKIKNLLAEKELILREVHHRIKNNMATVASLLSLQANRSKAPEAAAALKDAKNRVSSMAALYEKLYRSSGFREVSIKDYLAHLADEIVSNFPNREMVKIETHIADFIIQPKTASVIGMIVNELITNAMKHAFKGRGEGLISISASLAGKDMTLIVEDNGIGLPESIAMKTSAGFGFELIDMLAGQLQGGIKVERHNGTRFILEFKMNEV